MNPKPSGFDARLDAVPENPGVYLMKDPSGSVIYVGKAKNLKNRLRSYFAKNPSGTNKVRAMISNIADFDYVVVESELEALLLEANFIKSYNPKYNVLLRDDKGYPYVCITMNETYPRIFKAFRIGSDREKGAQYYGPFLGGDLYRALEAINDILPTKKCRKVFPRDIGKGRPCLNYHIGRCVAPCKGDVSAEDYRAVMFDVCSFFQGKYDGLQKTLNDKMIRASEAMNFEVAALYRDRLQALERIMASQKVTFRVEQDMDAIGIHRDAGEICIRKMELRAGRIVGSSTYFVHDAGEEESDVVEAFIKQYYPETVGVPPLILLSAMPEESEALELLLSQLAGRKVKLRIPRRGDGVAFLDLAKRNAAESLHRRVLRVGDTQKGISTALSRLQDLLEMKGTPNRIEAYDISNMGADDLCGSRWVSADEKTERKAYKLFKLKSVEGQNDYASMEEVLRRRLAHLEAGEWGPEPSLILIDGGRTHLSVARKVLNDFGLQNRICAAGMVKDQKHKTAGLVLPDGSVFSLGKEACQVEENLVLLRLLTAIQNEVHRFAISYQRKLSQKRHLSFKLESIPGIGPQKRKTLLEYFGTIAKIAVADVDTLERAPKISRNDALAIHRHFHRSEDI